MLTEREIRKICSRFPIFSRKIYLNSCSQGALSDAVEACIQEYLRTWHAGSPWDICVQKYEAVRAEFRHWIAAQPDEVAIVPSASAGIALLLMGAFGDGRRAPPGRLVWRLRRTLRESLGRPRDPLYLLGLPMQTSTALTRCV
jgi:selenocysteine lyase/cysteine desulfurase